METPLEKLKRMTAWNVDPTLTEDDLEAALATAALTDAAGLAPLSEEWTPTYNLNAAAAQSWITKAARAAATVEVGPPGLGIITSKVFDNCRAMAGIYAGKRTSTLPLISGSTSTV